MNTLFQIRSNMNIPLFFTIRRGIFLLLTISVLVSCTVSCRVTSERTSVERPNIIFLFTDDQRDGTFRSMGDPVIRTPNVDRLVRRGVRFRNTYVAAPVCAPSRVSVFTGLSQRVHGVGFSSSYRLTEDQWSDTYPARLRGNGYYTGFIGKFGIEYYTFRGEAQSKFDFWYAHDGWTKFFPKDHDSPSTRPYHGADHDVITKIMGEAVQRFLTEAPADQPFSLSVSFNVPHGSQTTSMYTGYEGWRDMRRPANENPKLQGHPIYGSLYRDTDLPVPKAVGSNPYRHIPRRMMDQKEGRKHIYTYSYSKQTAREHYVRYYQTITGLDRVIGNLMETLKKRGLADNTILIFASDNGLIMGEYGMGGKGLLYELSAKIPCFIYDPRLPTSQRGRTVDELVSTLDLPVTMLDYADVEPPEAMSGRSLVPLVYGKDPEGRESLFLESLFTMRDNPFSEGIRRGTWKYIRMYDGVHPYQEDDLHFSGREPGFEQLFNLRKDPAERTNLIKKYEGTDLLESLREKVNRHSRKLNARRREYRNHHDVQRR